MERKEFIKKGLFSFGSLMIGQSLLASCTTNNSSSTTANNSCAVSPSETAGPFPIKTPSELVKSNIVMDRTGVALLVKLTIQDKNCKPLKDVFVDIWHCDKDGLYSEYGGSGMQKEDLTNVHFLRGRQKTNELGEVSFISIYPGWYSSRAPHIHIEILNSSSKSLLVTQAAFPEEISKEVYNSPLYVGHGQADTPNLSDNVFSDSLSGNMAKISGNIKDGYTLTKTIVVNA
ncbi:MAG: intradiol ring-cleavage dioxygenase [Candidatus Sericytochromatia bacterium]